MDSGAPFRGWGHDCSRPGVDGDDAPATDDPLPVVTLVGPVPDAQVGHRTGRPGVHGHGEHGLKDGTSGLRRLHLAGVQANQRQAAAWRR